jgi:N utilization substance protein A
VSNTTSKQLIAGINQVALDKGLEREVIFNAIEDALVSAYKRNYGPSANVAAEVDRVTGEMRVLAEREVVEDGDPQINPRTEIAFSEAKRWLPAVQLGDVVKVPSTPNDFGRIAAQTAKQVILQRIREAERDTVFENFAHKIGEIIRAEVRSVDTQSGAVSLKLDDKHEYLMMREDQIPVEKLRRGDMVKVFVVDVHKGSRGPVIRISRTHRNLLRRLMEQEIPEVRDGIVEIKSIAREPGARSKAAVVATVPNIDPVGSCVGLRGLRIQNIVNALSPAKVQSVLLDESGAIKTATVIVPDRQLSLAIGKEGQNARLAAKLTGWRIDIKSESEARDEGLDQLIADRAQVAAARATDDLLAKAERILRNESETIEDKLWQAAQALTDRPSVESETTEILSADFRPLEELMKDVSVSETGPLPSFGEAPFEAGESDTLSKGADISWPTLQPEAPALPSEAAFSEAESSEKDALPEVITADMLRARMAKGKVKDNAHIEIPAELLAGYEGDLEAESADRDAPKKGGKGKGKPAGKGAVPAPKAADTKKKAPKKVWTGDDDLEDYF